MKLLLRRILGIMESAFYPRYSLCENCWRPWPRVKAHVTRYRDGSGCFPLCEVCWKQFTPEERLPYYKSLWKKWKKDFGAVGYDWEEIKAAVLAGL